MTLASFSRRSWLALVAALLAVAAVVAVALSPGGGRAAEFGAAPQSASAAAAKTITINIKDYEFSKKTLTIKKGQRVKWVNKDVMKHNAYTSKKGGPHGPLLAKGESYTWTATRKGTFKYVCQPHKEIMKATVIVK